MCLMMLWVLLEVAIAIGLFFLVNLAGSILTGKGYGGMSESDDIAQNNWNAMFRVMAPLLLWMMIHAGISLLVSPVFKEAYISIIIYWLIRLGYEYSKRTLSPKNYLSMWARAAISSALCVYLNGILYSAGWVIVPSADDVLSQFWLVAFTTLVLAASGTTANESEADLNRKFEKNYHELKRLASNRLPQIYSDDLLIRALFYSFGLYEMTYRTRPLRYIERCIARFKSGMTTGVMQVRSNRSLSDEESVDLAASIVANIWKEYLSKSEYAKGRGHLELGGDKYSYSLAGMKQAVKRDYEVIHKRYTGTSQDDTVFYFDFALRMVCEDDYLAVGEQVISGRLSALKYG